MNKKRSPFSVLLFAVSTICFMLCLGGITASAEYIYEDVEIVKIYEDKGDLTQDGKITFRDALKALKIMAKLEEAESEAIFAAADVDDDLAITSTDVKYIFDAALYKGESIRYLRPEGNYIIVDPEVSRVGNYLFSSSREAVDYLNANPPASEEERVTVLFTPGIHRHQLPLKAPYVTFRPMYPEDETPVTITAYYGNGSWYHSMEEEFPGEAAGSFMATLNVYSTADDFIAAGIIFENSYNLYVSEEEKTDFIGANLNTKTGEYGLTLEDRLKDPWSVKTPAQAVQCNGDRSAFYDCSFYGRQDTLYMYGKNRVYYEDCFIEGTVDFIYGVASAVFNRCTVNAAEGGGYLTAPGTEIGMDYGFLFLDCTMTRSTETLGSAKVPADSSYAIGRPWRAYGMVCFMNCKMDSHIAAGEDRIKSMSNTNYFSTMRFSEYGTMDLEGNPLDLETIKHENERILIAGQVSGNGLYAPWRWLWSDDDEWDPGNFRDSSK